MTPRTLILRCAGTNCDRETAHAFEQAGARVELMHVNALVQDASALDRFDILALPGGFSFGDDIAAGKILAHLLMSRLIDPLRRFVERGGPVIGICNGFQVLVKTELLPGPLAGRAGQTATLTDNACGSFVDRWVSLRVESDRCVWTRHLPRDTTIELPVAHGEGQFVCADTQTLDALRAAGQIALSYSRPDGSPAAGEFPHNPNGSALDIAGVCDATGLVFGLMPHPERNISPYAHPAWTSRPPVDAGVGLKVFTAAVEHVRQSR